MCAFRNPCARLSVTGSLAFLQRRVTGNVVLSKVVISCVAVSLGWMGTWGSALLLQNALVLTHPDTGQRVAIRLDVSRIKRDV
jgi:hypothetical protein